VTGKVPLVRDGLDDPVSVYDPVEALKYVNVCAAVLALHVRFGGVNIPPDEPSLSVIVPEYNPFGVTTKVLVLDGRIVPGPVIE